MLNIQNISATLFMVLIYPCFADTVTIHSHIADHAWQVKAAIYPLKGQHVNLKVVPIEGTQIRWYQIIPNISKTYKNANHPWEPDAYQWVGFGKIDYEQVEIETFRNQWEISFSRSPVKGSFDSAYFQEQVGSFWFQVEIEKEGKIIAKSAGLERNDSRGISPEVFRVSFRVGEDFLGHLSSFFNVPGIFGSTTYQSSHYIGADCADVLMSAYSRWKNIELKKDYNVGKVIGEFKKITELDIKQGIPSKSLVWEKNIFPGNFLAVRYSGAKQYQHIGVLYQDANNNGILDEEDWVIHAGPLPLHLSTLKEGTFDGHLILLEAR